MVVADGERWGSWTELGQLAFYALQSDGSCIENRRFVRRASSEEGVVEALEILLEYVYPTTMFLVDSRVWRRRGGA